MTVVVGTRQPEPERLPLLDLALGCVQLYQTAVDLLSLAHLRLHLSTRFIRFYCWKALKFESFPPLVFVNAWLS